MANIELNSTPDGGAEIDAWIYGYNWCSHSNFVSRTGDICGESAKRPVEFLHVPLTDKFGAFEAHGLAHLCVKARGPLHPICHSNTMIHSTNGSDRLRTRTILTSIDGGTEEMAHISHTFLLAQ